MVQIVSCSNRSQCTSQEQHQKHCQQRQEYHKGIFLGHCCSCSVKITCQTLCVIQNSATFADDTKFLDSHAYAFALETNHKNFDESAKNVNLKLNASKYDVLRVTRKHNKVIYLYKLSCGTVQTSAPIVSKIFIFLHHLI